jgi:hypothetical protein
VLDDPAVLHADDVDDVDLDLGAGRLEALERSGVRAGEDLAGDDLVAVRELVEYRRPEAGERGAEGVELLADACGAGLDPGGRLWSRTSGWMSSANARSSAPVWYSSTKRRTTSCGCMAAPLGGARTPG